MPVWYNEGLDDQPVFDVTGDFRGGMNTTMAPSLLPNNQYSLGENAVLDKAGGLLSRYGTTQEVSLTGSRRLLYYDTPSLEQLLLVSDNSLKVYNGSATSDISGYDGTGDVSLLQGVDRAFLATGSALHEYDGTNVYDVKRIKITITDGGSGYTSATVNVSGGSPVEAAEIEATVASGAVSILNLTNKGRGYTSAPTITISGDGAGATATAELVDPPTGAVAEWHTNRMFLAGISGKSDTIRVSDILDPSYWAVSNSFRVGGGEGESIIALKSWDVTNLLCFKESSTWLVQTDPTQDVANWPIEKVSDTVGCVAPQSAVQVGSDVWWLSRQGVVSVRRMAQETQREISAAISVPIQAYVDRINWAYASTATATFYDNKYLLAVPLDTATTPSHVFVYDTLHQCWAGIWTGLACKDMELTNFNSIKRLVLATSGGDVVRYDSNKTKDAVQGTDTVFTTKLWLRGYVFNEIVSDKTLLNCEMEFYRSEGPADLKASFDEENSETLAANVATSGPALTLPFEEEDSNILAVLGTETKSFTLLGRPSFRSMQPRIETTSGQLSLRTLKASAFLDTINLHTVS